MNIVQLQYNSFDGFTSDRIFLADILVVVLKIDGFVDDLCRLQKVLPQYEVESAKKFGNQELVAQYFITRSMLRLLISQIVSVAPSEISISMDARGKPFLDDIGLYFNLSHSKHWIYFAFSSRTELGIDGEEDDGSLCIEPLAHHVFSPREHGDFLALTTNEKRHAFFRTWTKKEAISKYSGRGLSLDFAQIDLGLPEKDGRVHEKFLPSSMRVDDIGKANAYYAALAYGTPAFRRRELCES